MNAWIGTPIVVRYAMIKSLVTNASVEMDISWKVMAERVKVHSSFCMMLLNNRVVVGLAN